MTDDETTRLRTSLAELQGEISRLPADGMDETRRTELLDLRSELERLLARHEAGSGTAETAAPHEEHQQLQGRLQTFVAGFEGAHPQIASALEQTMNALSNMGL